VDDLCGMSEALLSPICVYSVKFSCRLPKYLDLAATLTFHKQNNRLRYVKKSGNIFVARSSRFTYVFFSQNFCNVCGAKSVQQVDTALHELCDLFSIVISSICNIKIDNIMATGRVRAFPSYLEMEKYACERSESIVDCIRTEYNREKFPAIKLEFAPRGCAMLFQSGKVNILGCTEPTQADRIINAIAFSFDN
jgi:TATA-box binding protein (TBP) (component of TFIID and TFIIIB)